MLNVETSWFNLPYIFGSVTHDAMVFCNEMWWRGGGGERWSCTITKSNMNTCFQGAVVKGAARSFSLAGTSEVVQSWWSLSDRKPCWTLKHRDSTCHTYLDLSHTMQWSFATKCIPSLPNCSQHLVPQESRRNWVYGWCCTLKGPMQERPQQNT